MAFSFHDILCLVTIGQFFLLSIFLLTQQRGRRLSHIALAVFFLSKALGIFDHLVLRLDIASTYLYFALIPFGFLYGPSLYFYVRSVLDGNFSLKKRDVLHLLPFFLTAVYFIAIYYIQMAETKMQIMNAIRGGRTHLSAILMLSILHLLILGYILASFRALRHCRRELERLYSTIDRARLRWLWFILSGFTLIWAIDIVYFVLNVVASSPLVLVSSVIVLLFVFANIAVFKGLRDSQIFNGGEEMPKYQHSKLTRLDGEDYLRRVLAHMREEKPYLDPALTITKLGRRLSIPPRYLSQVINESLRLNFYDFVNSYRVEEVKKLLRDASNGEKNFLGILFEAGFNTKSAFNRAFKKHTGMTPSQYKRRQQSYSDRWSSRTWDERRQM